MIKLVVLFKQASNSPNFDLRYRRNRSLLKKMPGVQQVQESKVLGGPAGQAPYQRILEVFFTNFEALDQALMSPEGVTAGKDLIDYTGAESWRYVSCCR